MPRGGLRNPPGGRPKGSKNKRKRPIAEVQAEIVEIARQSNTTPLAYMLAALNDPNTPTSRKDSLAAAAAPYLHARISTMATGDGTNGGGSIESVVVIGIPRNAQYNSSTGMISYGDLEVPPPPFEPRAPTAELPALPAPVEPEVLEPLPVIEPAADDKLTVLDVWRRKKSDEDPFVS
jgi:hypothetical protein